MQYSYGAPCLLASRLTRKLSEVASVDHTAIVRFSKGLIQTHEPSLITLLRLFVVIS